MTSFSPSSVVGLNRLSITYIRTTGKRGSLIMYYIIALRWTGNVAAAPAAATSSSALPPFSATHALLTSPTWGCAGTGLNSDGSTSSSTWCGPRSGPVPGRPNQGRARRRSGGGRLRAPGAGAGTGLPRRTMPGLLGRLL